MASLVASIQNGPAPLSVIFTGDSAGAAFFGGIQIDFGDGATDFFCRPGKACKDTTATHIYTRPGDYIARLLGQGEGTESILATFAVKVD